MNRPDPFRELAPYYDAIMNHVDYGRWALTAHALTALFEARPVHLDAACGTGTLLGQLRFHGWPCFGIDISHAMLQTGRQFRDVPTAAADLRALPFGESIDFITCLFDSMNFLLTTKDLQLGIGECARVLRPGGILYFDAVTERMVLDHFAGQQWEETLGQHATAWTSRYSRRTRLSETEIRISDGSTGTIRERMYLREELEEAIAKAGLQLMLCVDAETWKPPRRRTVRLDFIAVKRPPRGMRKKVELCRKAVRALLA